MTIPPLKDADSITGDEVFVGIQGGRLKRFAVGLLRGMKGDTGPKGATGATGPAGPTGAAGATGHQGKTACPSGLSASLK